MSFPLRDKVAVVTGAGRGIGRAIAVSFARSGADLALVSRTPKELAETAELVRAEGRRALAAPGDVSREASVGRVARRVLKAFGRVDVLVNNAGVFVYKPFLELSVADWDRTLAVNLKGVFLCCRAFAPSMVARRSGRILNISSIHGRIGDANVTAQCASKFGVIGLTESLARELRRHNVGVNAICPGSVDAKADPSRPPLERKLAPEDVAKLAVFLASHEADAITGAAFDVHGGTGTRIEVRG